MKKLTINNLPELPWDVSEAINQLRVNLTFTGTNIKTIMVTSSIPNEGKSFVSMGLWRALAGSEKRTLFIDCDMRLSEIRHLYDMQTTDVFVGIAHLLSGQSDIPDTIYKTNVANGYILPVTNEIADPTVLLESERFKDLIDNCANAFDYVIIDCPPLESVSDALYVSKYCDGTILVVRSGYTKKIFVNNSVNSLKRAGSHILGFVLNRIDTSSNGSYYYKNYGNYKKEYSGAKVDKKKKKKKK